jgi:formamidopyrimidine-DNA glycosylase
MPELPDIVTYIQALEKRILGHALERIQLVSPFLLRTATPSIDSVQGKKVVELRRLGKRICIGVEDELWLVLHLMIAGRLHWKEVNLRASGPSGRARASGAVARPSGSAPFTVSKSKNHLAAFQFDNGLLSLTEAGTQRRASLHLVAGEAGLHALDPGGVELFSGQSQSALGAYIDINTFTRVLQSESHTLKRALTDPRLFSGIGNAYSDEILWQAQLSPVKLTQKLNQAELERLHDAVRVTLTEWVERLREETAEAFPEKVTAFRPRMAVHGRYHESCPRCGAKVRRIRYATNETNYCPTCQTGGKLLADRALSRLLREDWPKTAEELG